MASWIIELRTEIGNGNNFTSNHRFGHVIRRTLWRKRRLCESGCYVGFLFPRTSSGFWQTAIAMEGYPRVLKMISRPENDSDRLMCPSA